MTEPKMSILFRSLPRVVAYSALLASVFSARAQSSALPPTCKADASVTSDAEAALDLEDWRKADRLYDSMAKSDPSSLEAQAGLIRVRLGEGNIVDALKQATSLVAANPGSVIAQTVLGETYIRRGELAQASPVLSRALSLSACYGRTHLQEARLQSLLGYHASAAAQLAQAHALDPGDEQITLAWTFSLPPAQRYPLLKQFVAEAKYLNTDDREDLKSNVLEGEARMNSHCTVSSPSHGTATTIFETPLISRNPSNPSIDVSINGTQHRLAFDTSYGGIQLKLATAQHLHLQPLVKVSYSQSYKAGRLHYNLVQLDSIRIGAVEFKNCIALVIDEPGSGYSSQYDQSINPSGTVGNIGSMFFSDFLITMDSSKHQLGLAPLPPITATHDRDGLPLWSDVSRSGGDAVPSMNGGSWGQYNRTITPEMSNWTTTVQYHDRLWLPTVIGPGPAVLFELEFSEPWERVSGDAAANTARLETLTQRGSAPPFRGYFFEFAGLFFPVSSWTSVRFDEFSKHLKLETSGTLGQAALRQTTFTLDLRDHLVQFVRPKSK
jgi:tetratricopeptide (TPR) repeat protein